MSLCMEIIKCLKGLSKVMIESCDYYIANMMTEKSSFEECQIVTFHKCHIANTRPLYKHCTAETIHRKLLLEPD